MSTRTFELFTFPDLIEARTTPDWVAGQVDGALLAYANRDGRRWRCYRADEPDAVSYVPTKPEAKQRVREYATQALTSGGGS